MEDQFENVENYSTHFDKIKESKMYFMKEEVSEVHYIPHLKIEFENCFTSIAKNGGFVAFCKKPKVFIMDNLNPLKYNVIVMCQDGSHCKLIPYDEKNRNLVIFDFNYEEKLYGIHDDGSIIKFDIENERFEEKISGDKFKNEKIISAKLFEKGFFSQTELYNIYYTKEIKNPFPYLFFPLNIIEISKPIKEYIFIPSTKTKSKKIELIFPNPFGNGIIHITGKSENEEFKKNENGIYNEIKYIKKDIKTIYNKSNIINEELNEDDLGKISAIAISPSNNQIAMYRNDGTVFFFHSTLDDNLNDYPRLTSKFKINNESSDEYEENEEKAILEYYDNVQFLFCGEDAVCICGKRFIMLINSKNITLHYKITEKSGSLALQNMEFMFCCSEIDGLRVITHNTLFFIYKVCKEVFITCYPFSNHPVKKLLYSFKLDIQKYPESDKELRKIEDQLESIIKMLLICASKILYYNKNSLNKKIQFYLLKAAQYAKNYVDDFNFDLFVQMCKEIRVINNLNCCNDSNDKPRFITYTQYKNMGIKELIKKLIRQYNFSLAYDICKYLNLDYSIHLIYQKFAIAQIKKLSNINTIEEQMKMYEKISKKIKNIPNISYIKLAKRAFKYGFGDIGSKFLKEEKSLLIKIPQYIKLRDWETAILLAVDTCDRNVIFSVIDKIFKSYKNNTSEFIDIICKFDEINLVVIEYLKSIKETNHDLLEIYLKKKKLFEELFFIYLERFFEIKNLHERIQTINNLKECLKQIKSSNFDYYFYKDYINSLENSISFKHKLIEKAYIPNTDTGSFDNSIYDCYKICLSKYDSRLPEKENNNYKLSNKKLMILKLRTLAEQNSFDKINEIINLVKGNLKKLDITPFNLAQLYYDYKQYDLATEYIKEIIDPDYFTFKIEMLKNMEKYEEAIEMIISDKDCDRKEVLVNEILNKRPDLRTKCDELYKQFGK